MAPVEKKGSIGSWSLKSAVLRIINLSLKTARGYGR